MKRSIVVCVLCIIMVGCHTINQRIDGSLMSGNQNPASPAIGIGIDLFIDGAEYLYEYYDEEDYEEDED